MICSILEQHHLRHAALPADVAVGCSLLQPMAGSWLIRCTKLELEHCGKQTACVFTEDAAVLNQCLLFSFFFLFILISIADILLAFPESLRSIYSSWL